MSHFDPDRIVGRGGFGKVQAMTKNSTAGGDKGTMYAVKIMSKQVAVGRKMTAEFFTERNMLDCAPLKSKHLPRKTNTQPFV